MATTGTPLLDSPSGPPPRVPALQDSSSAIAAIPGARKAAIYLTAIGDKLSAEILRTLNDTEVYDITRELSILGKVGEQERQEVLDEFMKISGQAAVFSPGGIEYTTAVLINAFGPEAGKRMADRLAKVIGNDTAMIDNLRRADPQILGKLLRNEHPQTVALILCHIAASQAASLLAAMPQELQTEVTRRMAALDQISPETMNKLASTVWGKLRIVGDYGLEACGGTRTVAEVLNNADTSTADTILNSITKEDPLLAENIRELMFVFDDLLRLNKETLQVILSKVERPTLVLALKGSNPSLKAAFSGVMSSRAAEMLREDMEALGPVRVRDVQTAQQAIIAVARELQKEGLFSLQASELDQMIE